MSLFRNLTINFDQKLYVEVYFIVFTVFGAGVVLGVPPRPPSPGLLIPGVSSVSVVSSVPGVSAITHVPLTQTGSDGAAPVLADILQHAVGPRHQRSLHRACSRGGGV